LFSGFRPAALARRMLAQALERVVCDLHHSLAAQLTLAVVSGLEGAMRRNRVDADGVHKRRKLRWRRAKKNVAATDKKKDSTPLHALVEPADLTLVGIKSRAGQSDILT
jgi:hypothetical protein